MHVFSGNFEYNLQFLLDLSIYFSFGHIAWKRNVSSLIYLSVFLMSFCPSGSFSANQSVKFRQNIPILHLFCLCSSAVGDVRRYEMLA